MLCDCMARSIYLLAALTGLVLLLAATSSNMNLPSLPTSWTGSSAPTVSQSEQLKRQKTNVMKERSRVCQFSSLNWLITLLSELAVQFQCSLPHQILTLPYLIRMPRGHMH